MNRCECYEDKCKLAKLQVFAYWESGTVGLKVRPDKCGVYSPNHQAAVETAAALGIQHCRDGLTAAGTPVGTDAFVTAHATAKADAAAKSVDIILESPLPTQDKFLLLQASAQMKLAHLPRVSEWRLIGADVKRIEEKVANATFELMQRPPRPDLCAGQLTLPLRFGGLGIRSTTPLEASASFLSATARTENTMRAGPSEFRPLSGPNAARLQADWQALHTAGAAHEPPVWPPEASAINEAIVSDVLPEAQRVYARSVAKRRFTELLASFAGHDTDSQRNLARLNSCACGQASMWLSTLPVSPAFKLSDADFKTAMRLRLGLVHMPANAPGVQCSCGRYLQPGDTDHAMTCKTMAGAMTLRHNLITDDWRRFGTRAGVASSAEPSIRALPGARAAAGRSCGDILYGLAEGLTVADVSVVHPAATTFMHAGRVPGGAAAARDAYKRSKYQTADPHGYAFTPLSLETFGRLGKPAMELLNTLATAAAESGVCKRGFVTNALRQLSITLCRGNGIMFRRSLNVMATVTGTNFREGFLVPTADVS